MPVAAMLLATVLWSSALVGNKALVQSLAITEVALTRFGLAACLLWAIVLLTRQWTHLRAAGWRPMVMGLMEPGLVGLLFIWGQSYTSAVHATVFWSLMPLLMPLLGRLFLKEPIRPVVVVAAIIAFGGTMLLLSDTADSEAASLKGDLLCILGVLAGCGNQLLGRFVAKSGGRPVVTSALQITAGAALALVALLLVERPEPRLLEQPGGTMMIMLYMGFVASAGPFFLYNYALKHMPVGRISLFPPLVAPIGAAMAATLLDEALGTRVIAAIAIILFAVFLPGIVREKRTA